MRGKVGILHICTCTEFHVILNKAKPDNVVQNKFAKPLLVLRLVAANMAMSNYGKARELIQSQLISRTPTDRTSTLRPLETH